MQLDTRALTVPIHGMTARIHIGTQNWNYAAWASVFYPDETRAADYLSTYARAFGTVEIDSTFYAVPSSSVVRGWYDRTPSDFIFALKFPQAVTHEARLRNVDAIADLFFERARELRDKLGPILVQLGPDFGPEELPALVDFIPRIPRDLRVAIEFRARGWMTPAVLDLLRNHGIAVALVDGQWIPRRWMIELVNRPTASFHYVRWMGPDRALTDHSRIQVDRTQELTRWAEALKQAPDSVTDIYGYVSNYFAGHSPSSARNLQRMLGIKPVDLDTLGDQMGLF
jgi:uncharacterized protein YecE (DUF72 family)